MVAAMVIVAAAVAMPMTVTVMTGMIVMAAINGTVGTKVAEQRGAKQPRDDRAQEWKEDDCLIHDDRVSPS